jgi:hypothetical protein
MDTKAIIIKASLDPFYFIARFNINNFLLIVITHVILKLELQCQ